jgi:hypothetical protein
MFSSKRKVPFTKTDVAKICLLGLAIFTCSVVPAQVTNGNDPANLPGVLVSAQAVPETDRPGWLQEEQFVGPYDQPEWTTERRFPSTRVYLQQMPWETGFEQWVRNQDFRDGTVQTRFQEEFELGLPYRFQLDLYETWSINEHRKLSQDEYSAELRYALADWGRIPLNPTLYLEYAEHNNTPNTLEGKLLLGTDFSPRWHYGLNFACEQELSGTENTELAASQGISYTVIDQKFSAGLEMEFYHEKSRDIPEQWWFLLGPDLQWRPTSWAHLDFAPLAGCTHNSPYIEAYLVFGIDFGTGKEHYAPTSLRSQ